MDTNIWVIPIPIHGYLYILLPILKFYTDTKRYLYKKILIPIQKYGIFLIRPSNLFFRKPIQPRPPPDTLPNTLQTIFVFTFRHLSNILLIPPCIPQKKNQSSSGWHIYYTLRVDKCHQEKCCMDKCFFEKFSLFKKKFTSEI